MKDVFKRMVQVFTILLLSLLLSCNLFKEEEKTYSYIDYNATIEVKTLD